MTYLVNLFNKVHKNEAFSLLEVLITLTIFATLLTTFQWFGFIRLLEVPVEKIIDENQIRISEILVQQSIAPISPEVRIPLKTPCHTITVAVLAGGVVQPVDFTCNGMAFRIHRSGAIENVEN